MKIDIGGEVTKRDKIVRAAGWFDGEGCVKPYSSQCHSRPVRSFVYEIGLANNDHQMCKEMQRLFGGTISYYPTSSGKLQARWRASGKTAEDAARAMLPFSLTKKKQLRLFVRLRQMVESDRRGTGRALSTQERSRREILIAQIKQAKKDTDIYVS
jgi:hypothetical protein